MVLTVLKLKPQSPTWITIRERYQLSNTYHELMPHPTLALEGNSSQPKYRFSSQVDEECMERQYRVSHKLSLLQVVLVGPDQIAHPLLCKTQVGDS